MKKNFRSIKATLIMGILLVSLLVAMVPTISAGPLNLISLESYVNLKYDPKEFEDPIMIRGAAKTVEIEIEYGVTGATIFQIAYSILHAIHEGRSLTVEVKATGFPDWADVSISHWPTLRVPKRGDRDNQTVYLTLKVEEDAPAFGKGNIKLEITAPDVGSIKGIKKEVQISFNVGYTPIVSHEYPEGNSKVIGPMDTAEIPIELVNLGNARTRVKLEVSYMPDGWSAIITDDVFLEEGEGSRTTVYLTVKPPKNFGYHDDSASIVVKYTPEMAEQPQFKGEAKPLNVLIESRGISVIGIEMIILPIIMIIVILLLIYHFVLKKRFGK